MSIDEFCREAAEGSASMQGGCEMWNFKLPCFGIEYIIYTLVPWKMGAGIVLLFTAGIKGRGFEIIALSVTCERFDKVWMIRRNR